MEHGTSFYLNNDFRTCLYNLMTHGTEAHPRGTTTKEVLNYNITLQDPRNRVITFPARKTNVKYLLGELIWYILGSDDPAGILPYSKFWSGIVNSGDEAGYTASTINSNYGTRLFGLSELSAFTRKASSLSKPAPINQWQATVELLSKDKDSRQAIMNIHVPSDRHMGNKDVPCTLTLQWFIREDKLSLIVNMRSNDVILGFTNDVFQFTMLQEIMMHELRAAYPTLELGTYYHNAGSMHIYDRHFEMAKAIINTPKAMDISMIPMDRWDAEIRGALINLEQIWTKHGQPADGLIAEEPEDFDRAGFDVEFNKLSPYWQTLVKAFFFDDTPALHALFGMED